MGFTMWDLSSDTNESWRRVRALRAQTPEGVTDVRRPLFSAALEQAEQQFMAAAQVGVQSKPLNLFYGLSQAGRAVAAALTPEGEDFELKGHGIGCPGIDELLRHEPVSGFPTLRVRGSRRTGESFTHLSSVLRSAPLESALELRALWGMLYEPSHREPLDSSVPRVRLIEWSGSDLGKRLFEITDVGLGFTPEALPDFQQQYPALRDMTLESINGPHIELSAPVRLDVAQIGVDYRGHRLAMPAIDESNATMHPLMAWWAVLYALSMIARYHPAAWTAITNVDESRHAVPVEYLLSVAQSAVPDVLWRTLSALP